MPKYRVYFLPMFAATMILSLKVSAIRIPSNDLNEMQNVAQAENVVHREVQNSTTTLETETPLPPKAPKTPAPPDPKGQGGGQYRPSSQR